MHHLNPNRPMPYPTNDRRPGVTLVKNLCLLLTAVCMWTAPTLPTAAQEVPAAAPRAGDDLVDGLIRGYDQREAVALYRAARKAAPRPSQEDRLAQDFQDHLAVVLHWAHAALEDPARPLPRAALDRLAGDRLLLARRLEAAAPLHADAAPAIKARAAAADAHLAELFRLIDALQAEDADTTDVRRDLAEQLTAFTAAPPAATPILRASALPFNRTVDGAPPLVTAPVVLPAYQNPAAAPAGIADLAASDDTPLSDPILAQAAALDYDYVRIFDFVHGSVRTEVYAGAMKGAEATLRTLAGNDVDQAALLIALFRAAGLPARFVHGAVRLPIEEAGLPLGLTEPTDVVAALNAAGVAHQPVIQGSRITAVIVAHTWVDAYAPYTHYRGTSVDPSGKSWIPLDPSVKGHTLRPATGVLDTLGFDGTAFSDAYLTQNAPLAPWDTVRDQVESHLRAHPDAGPYDEQGAAVGVDAPPLGLLPAGLPYTVEAVTAEAAELAPAYRHMLHIRAETLGGDVVMDAAVPVSRLLDHRITFSYEPATVDDHNVIARYAGRARVPAYLVRLRPQLNLDGLPLAVGEGDLAMAESHRLILTLEGPGGTRSTEQVLQSGSYAALGLSAQAGRPPILDQTLPDDREQKAARLLYNHVAGYQAAWDAVADEAAGLYNLAVVRPLPALALVFTHHEPSYAGALPMRLNFRGVQLDAPLRTAVPFSRTGDADAAAAWMRVTALQGSRLESSVFEDTWGTAAISADLGLQLAADAGHTVHEVTAANVDDLLPLPAHAAAVNDHVRTLALRGYRVLIPDQPVTRDAWTGSVWAAFGDDGASGYFLSGAIAGGATTQSPQDWALQELADILGNPYDGEPNSDPLAAARIRRMPASDGQLGVAGEDLEQPLAVLVTDSYGRPVEGAQVAFRINLGGGKLNGGGPDAVVLTDALGIAEATLTLNTSTSENPVFAYLNPGDEYVSQLGETWINAAVVGFNGPISLDRAFTAYAQPGEPAKIRIKSGDELSGAPGGWVGPVQVSVEDMHGNAIANRPVTFSGGVPIDHISCGGSPSPVLFFAQGDCDVPTVPGSGCGQPSLEVTTSLFGAAAQVVNGDTGGVEYPIVIRSPDTPDAHAAAFSYGACGRHSLVLLQGSHYATSKGTVRDAAKPGARTPLPRRANLVYGLYVVDGDTPVYNKYVFYPTSGDVTLQVVGGGTTAMASTGAGTYEGTLQVGPTPSKYDVRLSAEHIYYQYRDTDDVVMDGETDIFGDTAEVYAVAAQTVEVVPDPVIVDLDGTSAVGLSVAYQVDPAEYVTPVQIKLFEDGQVVQYRYRPEGPNTGSAVFPPGMHFDLHKTYEVEVLINPDTEWEVKSERTPVRVTKQIFSHVANAEIPSLSANMPVGGGPVANDAVGPPLLFYSDYDIPNQILCEVAAMSYGITQDATISLVFEHLDLDGNPDGTSHTIVDNVTLSEGEHPVFLPLRSRLGTGDWRYTFTGTSGVDGHVDTVTGQAVITVTSRNALPVGHPVVKGVDLYDGSFSHSVQDLEVPGKGVNLEFSHSYTSKSRDQPGVMGFGWTHNYLANITQTRCGDFLVGGTEGGTMRFVQDGSGFRPLRGYHGTLTQEADGGFAYYSPGGTKYVYRERQPRTWWLECIEDGNGNRTTLTYQQNIFAPRLTQVTDASGRSLSFVYSFRNFGTWNGDVLTEVRGPGGVSLTFAYDDQGNLTDATRAGRTSETYTYASDAGPVGTHLLASIKDNIGGETRSYQFQEESFQINFAAEPFTLLVPVVQSVTEVDGHTTRFSYVPGTNGGFSAATVTDGRGLATTHTMNAYGAATRVAGPGGSFDISWDMDQVVKTSSTDPNGVTTTYQHDDDGNMTRETSAGRTRSYTYFGSGAFRNFNKNLPSSYTDGDGNVTTFTYDGAGNLLSESKGGRTTSFAYDGSGNRRTMIDGGGNITSYNHNANGYLTRETDPTGATRASTWDVLGRQLSITDGMGGRTTYTYDARDRRTSEQRPGGVTLTTTYNDGAHGKTEKDGNGGTTVTTTDALDRVLSVRNPLGQTIRMTYDGNGNKLTETDTAGRLTTYTYDGGNRMSSRAQPGGRTTTFTYDGVGNLKSEVTAGRTLTYTYDAFGNRTGMTRNGLPTTYTYDKEGHKTSETDPLGRTTSWTYDTFGNRLTERGPLGSGKTYVYDGAGYLTRETVNNSTGNRISYHVVDALGRRLQTTDPTGSVRTFELDDNGRLVREVDGRGKATTHTYDAAGNRTSTRDPEGGVTTFTHDANGNVLTETRPNGQVITYSYDALNRELSRSDTDGLLAAKTYDAAGNTVTETNARGITTTHTYDDADNLRSSSAPDAGTRNFSYNVFGERLTETDGRGNEVVHAYDTMGRLSSSTGPAGTLSYTYDDVGNLRTETDGRGNVLTHTYNDLDQEVTKTDPVGTVSYTYDLLGNKLTETDGRGVTTTWTYDRADRVTSVSRAGIRREARTYDAAGNPASLTDARGNTSSYEYDANNRLIVENRPALAVTRFDRDAVGNVVAEHRPGGATITRGFDKRGRKLSETDGSGQTTDTSYDGNGNILTVEKPQGTWTMTYDDADRLASVEDPLGHTTTYTYDADGHALSQTLGGHTVSFTYDEAGRRDAKIYPDGRAVTFTYDADGNPLTRDDPNGVHVVFSHDARNRLVSETYTGANGDVAIATTRDPNGNPVTVTRTDRDGSFTTTRVFDAFDRPTSVTDDLGRVLTYTYDAGDNRTAMRDHDGITTTYAYDALNRLDTVSVPGMGDWTYTYRPNSTLAAIAHPNGARTDYAYDGADRITEVVNSQNGEDVTRHAYTYDAGGRRTRAEDTNGAGVEVTTYDHDAADRLVSVTYPDRTVTYTHDAAGNRLTEDTDGQVRDYSYNSRHQLTEITGPEGTVTYGYDASGNMTTRENAAGVLTLAYDARNRLIGLSGANVPDTRYGYDAEGLRLTREVGPDRITYVYDGTAQIAQTNNLGSTLARYHYGAGRRLAERRAGDKSFFLQDALGSPVALTAADGTVRERTTYDAWGNIERRTGTSVQPFGFTGFEKDDESGLYYARNRYYDSASGRFLREDPYDGDRNQPVSLHPYLYGSANPTLVVDPSGLYGEAGHYYTTYYVARTVGYSADEAAILAFYAQAPDEVGRWDAINQAVNVRKRGIGRVVRLGSETGNRNYRQAQQDLIDVQQGLHSLTGTDSAESSRIVADVVRNAPDLATAGVAIHPLGDTFAHRVIDGEDKLYETDFGHLRDGHKPDQIHRRPELYKEYVNTLASALADRLGTPITAEKQAQLEKLLGAVETAKNNAWVKQYRRGHRGERTRVTLRFSDSKAEDLTLSGFKDLIAAEFPDSVLLTPEEHDIGAFLYTDHRGDEQDNIDDLIKEAEDSGVDGDKAVGRQPKSGIENQLRISAERVIREIQTRRAIEQLSKKLEELKEQNRKEFSREPHGLLIREPIEGLDQALGPRY